ncbi:MAG: hypothetical protein ACK4VW_04265 [Anaerolineales bacterium]
MIVPCYDGHQSEKPKRHNECRRGVPGQLVGEETGELLYRNAWVTDWAVDHHTVEGLAQTGRTRWKVENENINVLMP